MVPDKFDMVDMGGIDLIESQGVAVEGLYQKLVESITLCRYQCLYNWKFNGILIPPSYVEMENREDGVWINEGVNVDENDVVHIYSIEIEPEPEITPLSVTENGEYYAPVGVDGYNPVSVDVQSVRNYSNGTATDSQITDISGFDKLYSTEVRFGNLGTRVNAALSLTDESVISENQKVGWNGPNNAFYDSENIKGAYGGYSFNSSINISKVKFWFERYVNQNKTLYVTIQYLDSSDEWIDLVDLEITSSLPYPSNIFEVQVQREVKGIRWIHSKDPVKSSNNNIVFSGMTLYAPLENPVPVYIPSSGLNLIPEGYTGFAAILL